MRVDAVCAVLGNFAQVVGAAHAHPAVAGFAIGLTGVEPLPIQAGDDVAVECARVAFVGHGQAVYQLAVCIHTHQPGAGACCHGEEPAARLGHDGMRQAGYGERKLGFHLSLIPVDVQGPDLVVVCVHAPAACYPQRVVLRLGKGERRQGGGSNSSAEL